MAFIDIKLCDPIINQKAQYTVFYWCVVGFHVNLFSAESDVDI